MHRQGLFYLSRCNIRHANWSDSLVSGSSRRTPSTRQTRSTLLATVFL